MNTLIIHDWIVKGSMDEERTDVKGLRKGREGSWERRVGGGGLSKGIVIGHEELTGQATSGIDQDPVGSRTSDESLHRQAEVRSSIERKMAGSLSPAVVLSHALALAHYVDWFIWKSRVSVSVGRSSRFESIWPTPLSLAPNPPLTFRNKDSRPWSICK